MIHKQEKPPEADERTIPDRPVHRPRCREGLFRCLAVTLIPFLSSSASAQYDDWRHRGSFFIFTTPDGADLPAAAVEKDVPVLFRLQRDFFDFREARPGGEDIRFSGTNGAPLRYQIEHWDAASARAAIWVRIPEIRGNTTQRITMHWGESDAASESNAAAVFLKSNGFLSVWHMNDSFHDELELLSCKNVGTTEGPGMVAGGRRFAAGQGIQCGETINTYPHGDRPSSTSLWFRAEVPNVAFLGWGNEGGNRGSKVKMFFRSPAHVHVDSDFADVSSTKGRLDSARWVHVVHSYDENGNARLYMDGELDGHTKPPRDIKRPSRMWIGGWYNHFRFVGDIDEVRISAVARSADWIKLQYENQKPFHTLVGPLVRPGERPALRPQSIAVDEGESVTVVARANGAHKIYWILKRDGTETVESVDRLSFKLEAGRVTGDQSATLQLKVIDTQGVNTVDIPVVVREAIPEPVVTLNAVDRWDGREAIEVVPRISNLTELQAARRPLRYSWRVSGLATIADELEGTLLLKRAQKSGTLTVSVAVNNGGTAATAKTSITVTEPEESDAWVPREPGAEEQPEDHQFYARDDRGFGTLYHKGTLEHAAESVLLRIYVGDSLEQEQSQKLTATREYTLSARLEAGLVEYRSELLSKTAGKETLLHAASDLVCGDAYVIQGQSNAEANDGGNAVHPYTSGWIRSFGSMRRDPQGARKTRWGKAASFHRDYQELQIGYWGMELAKQLLEEHRIPVFIINGANGGTRIDQHQRNARDPTDVTTIYGRLLWRIERAKLTHGIRAVLWHQGENDQGAAGPSGGFGWETYEQLFIDLAAAWKTDFPNLRNYYICQIWPKACSMGSEQSDDMLREVQRRLPYQFSNMSIISTLGIRPGGSCHYPAAGYAKIARALYPLVARDHYGRAFDQAITPPDLQRAYFKNAGEIVLEFDQDMTWENEVGREIYLDDAVAAGVTGIAAGRSITLKLPAASNAGSITYVKGESWNVRKPVLEGKNGIAALTFYRVPITAP